MWVLRGGVPDHASIHVGLTDGTVTEILDGISEGDPVIVDATGADATPAPTSTGTNNAFRRMF